MRFSIFVRWHACILMVFLAIGVSARVCYAEESHGHESEDHAAASNGDDHEHGEADHAAHGDDGHGDGGHDEGEAGHHDAEHDAFHIDTSAPPLMPDARLLIFSLVTFLLYVFLAKRFAWLPLIEGLDAREARVNRALADAEQARIEAEKLLADHRTRMSAVTEEVRGIVAAARSAAEKEKARVIAEADREAAALRDGALAEIDAARQAAMADLDTQVDGQANAAVDHLLRPRF
ncbi:MAG: ATP synthase F0 subunit B [Planctomycetaceae bacterium]|nr:ATP synthase F0 subunit B [Planctomycetaceae bacterium]